MGEPKDYGRLAGRGSLVNNPWRKSGFNYLMRLQAFCCKYLMPGAIDSHESTAGPAYAGPRRGAIQGSAPQQPRPLAITQ